MGEGVGDLNGDSSKWMTLGKEIMRPLDKRIGTIQKLIKKQTVDTWARQHEIEEQLEVMTNVLECHRVGTITKQQDLDDKDQVHHGEPKEYGG
jgi:hypothetical protein